MVTEISSWTELEAISDMTEDYVLTEDLTTEDADYGDVNEKTKDATINHYKSDLSNWMSGDIVELHFDEDNYGSILSVEDPASSAIAYTKNDNTITLDEDVGDNQLVITYGNAVVGHEPIGTQDTPFTGTFDGQGHNIEGLYVNRASFMVKPGLFGYCENLSAQGETVIRDLDLINVEIVGPSNAGAVCGIAEGGVEINNVTVTGRVEQYQECLNGGSPAGGIANNLRAYVADGSEYYPEIIDCDADVTVTGIGPNGGLVGLLDGGVVKDSYSEGDVTATDSSVGLAGGLVGNLRKDTYSQAKVSDSYAMGGVTGEVASGGLVGIAQTSTIENSYATGSVADTTFSGMTTSGALVGIVGDEDQSNPKTLTLNYGYANSETAEQSNLYNLMSGGLGEVVTDDSEGSVLTTSEMTDYENEYPQMEDTVFVGSSKWVATDWNEDNVGNTGYPAPSWQSPLISNPSVPRPAEGEVGVMVSSQRPKLGLDVKNNKGQEMTVRFYDASDDTLIGKNNEIPSGSRARISKPDLPYGSTFQWYAEIEREDGTTITTNTYSFDTVPEITFPEAGGGS